MAHYKHFRLAVLLALFTGLWICAATGASAATLYEVGPGKPYARINDVDFKTLGPGDEVRVYWKDGGYNEKIFITTQGTAANPIKLVGVIDSQGRRPIIDGTNATSPSAPRANTDLTSYRTWWEPLGLLLVDRASHVRVENFEVRNAYSDSSTPRTYRNSGGTSLSWGSSTGVYVIGSDNVVIRNCEIHGNADGVFVNSNNYQTKTTTFEYNYIYGNGTTGSFLYHNAYTEGDETSFIGNVFGALRSGSAGTCGIKTRDTNATIAYNVINAADTRGGTICARLLDAVEIQSSLSPQATPLNVFGNVFINNGSSSNPIHFGFEWDPDAAPNNKIMNFYHNTYVYSSTASNWRMGIFDVSDGYTVKATNNIFYWSGPTQIPAFMYRSGRLELANDWASSVIRDNTDTSTGTVVRGTVYTNSQDNPGFRSVAADLHLVASADVRDKAVPLSASLPAVTFDPGWDLPAIARAATTDLGAYNYSSTAPTATATPTPTLTPTATSTNTPTPASATNTPTPKPEQPGVTSTPTPSPTSTATPVPQGTGTAAPTSPQSDLVLLFDFEEDQQSKTALDSSRFANNGTIKGQVRRKEGVAGQALKCSANTIVRVKDSSSLDLSSAFTLSAFVKPREEMAAESGWATILVKEAKDSLSYALYGGSKPKGLPAGCLRTQNNKDTCVFGMVRLPDGWSHLAAVYDGAKVSIYINGVSVGSAEVTGELVTSGGALSLCANRIWDERFAGLLDHVAIYKRALTPTELHDVMVEAMSGAAELSKISEQRLRGRRKSIKASSAH